MPIQLSTINALCASTLIGSLSMFAVGTAHADDQPFLPHLVNSTTIPSNGDVNPYGVAFVPHDFPAGSKIAGGDVLVSNFNASNNTQGTGSTIVQFKSAGPIAASGLADTFFTSKLPGLSTALGVLKRGFVLVGNVPTTDGTYATIGEGALQVIDRNGNWIATWTDPTFLDGPWDLAIHDQGSYALLFVSNVLNGTVSRFELAVTESRVNVLKKATIAAGYTHLPNAAALVLGPTGLAYDDVTDTLYVASTADNTVFAVRDAAARTDAVTRGTAVLSNHQLRGPLALRLAPNDHLLAANGDAVNADPLHPSEIIEFTKDGEFVREYNVDASEGGAFGLDTQRGEHSGFDYAVIDDVTNNLSLYRFPSHR